MEIHCEACSILIPDAVRRTRRFCDQCRKDRTAASGRKHYVENRDEVLARVKRRNRETRPEERKRYHERYRTRKLARLYGTSIEETERLLAITSCQICHSSDRQLVIDHDHGTGAVRGRLCQNCNRALGLLGDNAMTLTAAVHYLSKGTS